MPPGGPGATKPVYCKGAQAEGSGGGPLKPHQCDGRRFDLSHTVKFPAVGWPGRERWLRAGCCFRSHAVDRWGWVTRVVLFVLS